LHNFCHGDTKVQLAENRDSAMNIVRIRQYDSVTKRRFAMIHKMMHKERSKVIARVTAMDVYRCFILGLVGTFYGFLVFLMFL
jgi:hypothetical protein